MTNFKRDEAIEALCARFSLSDAARCRLVELRVRRGARAVAEDHRRLAEHLALCAEASWALVALVKKVTQGRLAEVPDLERVRPLMERLDEVRERVEGRFWLLLRWFWQGLAGV